MANQTSEIPSYLASRLLLPRFDHIPRRGRFVRMELMDPSLPRLPRDLSHHLTRATQLRQDSAVKRFYKFFEIPQVGNLAGGLPNPSLFPFDTLEATLAKPDRLATTPNYYHVPDFNTRSKSATLPQGSQGGISESLSIGARSTEHITVPRNDSTENDPFSKIDISTALQYGAPGGYPPLLSFLRQFTRKHLHPNVPYLNGPEIILTCGATDGFSKVVEMIAEPWLAGRDCDEKRQGMLCDVFTYPNATNTVICKGINIVPVDIDAEGMMVDGPKGLQSILKNWDIKKGHRPHFMYTVPTGQNPTGGVLSFERRRKIYALCKQYDIIIVEDDPYWHLQFPSAASGEAKSRGLIAPSPPAGQQQPNSSGFDFLDSLVPSYLSIDTDGRVIRLDTLSKSMAPGCRLGWITAQPMFIERLTRITETTTQQPSGFVQATMAKALIGAHNTEIVTEIVGRFRAFSLQNCNAFEGWNMEGWVRWLAGIRGSLERRMQNICTILDEHAYQLKQSRPAVKTDADWGVISKTRILSFTWPRGGMFIWLRIHFENHPLWKAKGETISILDGPVLSDALLKFLAHKPCLVVLAPGSMFSATDEIKADRAWCYFRVCFAAETADRLGPVAKHLVDGLHKFWRIKNPADMEKLAKEMQAEDVSELDTEDRLDLGFARMGC